MACILWAFGFLASAASSPVPLIIDTDIGGGGCMDLDDVGAVCLANALQDNGEAKILAVVVNTRPVHGVGVVSVLNHYYGRDDIPIGAYKGTALSPGGPQLPYVDDLIEKFSSPIKNSSQVPDSIDVYRKALAGQSDHSVVISSIGLLTNLEGLLKSEPDHHSALNGYDLVAKKVKLLTVMGGNYPSASSNGAECNFCGCYNGADASSAAAAEAASGYVFAHMPPQVRIMFIGSDMGVVQSGAPLETCMPDTNPCRHAYMNFKQTRPGAWTAAGRSSWDDVATLAAVRGPEAVACAECTNCDGVNEVDPKTGLNNWRAGAASNQTYVVLKNATAAGEALDKLYCQAHTLHMITELV